MSKQKYFDERSFYKTTDPDLTAILAPQTLRRWRHKGRGPAYVKLGSKILYPGAALNAFLESRLVQPTAA